MRYGFVMIAFLSIIFLIPAAALSAEPEAGVVRVSYVKGDVSFQRGDDDGWNALGVNTPVMTGDSLYASDDARMEFNLGRGNVVRADAGTQVDLVSYTRDVAQLGLSSGYISLKVKSVPQNYAIEVDTPSAAATIWEPGVYRFQVGDGYSRYTVVRGGLSVALDGEQLDVNEGECLELEGDYSPTYAYTRIPSASQFDGWCDERDRRYDTCSSAKYVHSDVVGYEDLDESGSWRDVPTYGRIWVPRGVTAEWAPYQSGRWLWQDPYGWTWVSYEPWGWAPYHYGRWVWAGSYWGWVPPPPVGYAAPAAVVSIQPVYAPALVAFVGGKNWSVGISLGGGPSVGWVPLAPREPYYYAWQQQPRVSVNYTNITVVNAVTVVNYNNFATGPVRPIRVDQRAIRGAPVIGYTAVGVVPTRQSLVPFPERKVAPRAIPVPRAGGRPLVARLVPPPKPLPFKQKLAEIEKTGKPVARPIMSEGDVGKPFRAGMKTPAGTKAVSALSPEGGRKLKAKQGSEAKTPKKIDRDIAAPSQKQKRDKPEGALEPRETPGGKKAGKAPGADKPERPEGGKGKAKGAEGVNTEAGLEKPAVKKQNWQPKERPGERPTGDRGREKVGGQAGAEKQGGPEGGQKKKVRPDEGIGGAPPAGTGEKKPKYQPRPAPGQGGEGAVQKPQGDKKAREQQGTLAQPQGEKPAGKQRQGGMEKPPRQDVEGGREKPKQQGGQAPSYERKQGQGGQIQPPAPEGGAVKGQGKKKAQQQGEQQPPPKKKKKPEQG